MADNIDEQVTAHIREILRLVLDIKGKLQCSNTGTSKRTKKPKLPDNECLTDTLPTEGPFKEPATNGFTSNCPTEPQDEPSHDHPSVTPPDTAVTSISATSEPTVDYPDITEALESSGMDDLPISATHIQIEGSERVDDMSLPTTHYTGYNILNEFFGQPAIDPSSVSDVEGPGNW
ncbi:hypothetical protein NA56DRAFT_703465 [Hyaloscypha hepaticicola]|uniref:Uncharacterized protein n=1 Tax=Hyaloscypha hepaticicola TaxID=2082293 RepID=A0A2J6Q4R0_9HELO|nr:hypothetical protein NA56DRAFT_703465 [Hyaloscypha hepaticicola]